MERHLTVSEKKSMLSTSGRLNLILEHLSVGAQADSTHEYLLKLYLLTGKTDKVSLEMCMCFRWFAIFLLTRLH